MGLVLLALVTCAHAAQVTKVGLMRNHTATRVVMKAESPFEFQVDLADPQTIVISLPGSEITAAMPGVGDDPLLASLEKRPGALGAELVVRTKAPGMTVLPFYEAASRTLTLEVGGSPAVEVKVPDDAPAVEPPPAKPAAPAAKPEAPQKQAAPPAAPAPAVEGPVPAVAGIRLGTHSRYTRLVLDADKAMEPRLAMEGQRLVLGLARGMLLPDARLGAPDQRVRGLSVLKAKPLRVQMTLDRPLGYYNMFPLEGGRKVVLDIGLAEPGGKRAQGLPTPEKAFGLAEPEPKAAAKPKAEQATVKAMTEVTPEELKTTPELPVAEPQELARPQAGTPQDPAPMPQAPPNVPQPAEQAPASPAPVPAAKPAPLPAPPVIRQAALATTQEGKPSFARGKMPPIPPPPALARPRGKYRDETRAEAAPESKAPPVGGKIAGEPAQAKAPEQLAAKPGQEAGAPKAEAPQAGAEAPQVKAEAPRAGPEAKPGVPGGLPPQMERIDPRAFNKKNLAQEMFDRAKEALDSRQYAIASDLFEQFLVKYPKNGLAAEATFRAADAFFYQHSKKMEPIYLDVMEKYQRAVDLYPESDQVPWAFVQMGKTAMLAGEPYRAAGYYQLVTEDYPKSEYVPVALVDQGRAYLSQGKYIKALDEFRRVARDFPDSRYRKDADWGQAQALFGMSRYERASLLLQDMDRRFPELRIKEPELLYYIGEAEFQLKNYLRARRYFLWALNIMPNIPDNDIILARVGDTYQYEGAFKAAKEIYRQVIDLYPGTDGALVAQIRVAESPVKDQKHPWDIFQVKATTEAFKVYQEIVRKYPNRPVAELAQLKLGVFYYKSKEYAKSLQVLNRLLRSRPRTNFKPEADYAMNLAAVALLGGLQKADKPLELMNAYLKYRGIISRPNSNEMLAMLAWAYGKTGLAERAANLYRVLIDRGVKDPTLRVRRAENLLKDMNYQGAMDALDGYKLLGLDKKETANATAVLARANLALGKNKQATKLFQDLAKMDSRLITARDNFGLGKAYAKLGEYDKSLASLDKASEQFSLDPAPRTMVYRFLVNMEAGQAALKAGKSARAMTYYQEASKRSTSRGERCQALYSLSRAYQAAGDAEKMIQTLERIKNLSADPWSQMAARRLEDLKLAPRLAKVGK